MNIRTLGSALLSGHWPTLLGAWLHLAVSFMVWLLFGALAVAIGEELRLTASQLSVLVAVPLLSGALLRVAAGWSCDWYGAKRTGLLVLGLQLAAALWAALGGTSYGELLGIGLLLGAGGASFAVAMPVASRVYPTSHQGLVLGLVASGNVGTVLALLLAPRWEATLGWHGACGVMALPILMALGVFARVVQEAPPTRHVAGGTWRQAVWGLVRLPSVYWLCVMYGITFGGFVGLTSFLPVLLHEQYDSDPVAAGSIAALCGLIGSLIRPVGGYVADRWGGLPVLMGVFVFLALTTALAGSLSARTGGVGLFMAVIAVMGLGNGVIFQIVSEWFPKDIGVASGLVGAAGGIGGFLVPLWFGLLWGSTGTFVIGFIGLAVVSACAAVTVSPALRWRHRGVAATRNVGGFSH
ncbi:MAG: Nitrate transporter NasA [Nitrospira sp.]|jgi:NNP family nitrate/nitrite transporter-like MFS transporter|nr:MAG: Nitrate transporter NasA [Nitrospira sp.]